VWLCHKYECMSQGLIYAFCLCVSHKDRWSFGTFVCVCVSLSLSLNTHISSHLHSHILACIHAYIHTSWCACMKTKHRHPTGSSRIWSTSMSCSRCGATDTRFWFCACWAPSRAQEVWFVPRICALQCINTSCHLYLFVRDTWYNMPSACACVCVCSEHFACLEKVS
jgi:hypothetical protein